mgnify:CR=1 FL=1
MTGTSPKPTRTTKAAFVDVVVVVNHEDLRRGERGEVELTDTVRGRLDKGYLRLAEPQDTEEGMPPMAGLGATAAAQGSLLGVEAPAGSAAGSGVG